MVTQVPDETKPCSTSWTWKSTKGVRAIIYTAWKSWEKKWFLPDCERMCLMKNCLACGKKSTCFAHPAFWLSEPHRKIWMPAWATEKGLYLSSGGILPQTITSFLGEIVPYFFFRQSIVTSPLMMCPATIQNFVYWYWRYCSTCTWKLEPIKNLGKNL